MPRMQILLLEGNKNMKRFFFWNKFLCTLLTTLIAGIFMTSGVWAEVSNSGDIRPEDLDSWDTSTYSYIGYENSGTMTVNGGSQVNDSHAYLGYESSASGTVTVDGDFSRWTNGSDLYVAKSGTGTLYVTRGGMAMGDNAYLGYDSEASGKVIVDSEGSAWINSVCNWSYLYAGFYGTGTLEITNGSEITNSDAYLGYHTDASGNVTVDGKDSMWGLGDLYAGNSGTGIISITNGGTVRDSNAYIGYYPGSSGSVTVDGEGATWSNYNLSVGQGGTGIVHITNGGTVTHNSINTCYLGHDTGASGTVTVDGEGSTWSIHDQIRVGDQGTGLLAITNGGTVTCKRARLGSASGANGEVAIDGQGSTWSHSDTFLVGMEGTGRLAITNGGALTSEHVTLGYDTNGNGTVIVDGAGSTWTNSRGFDIGLNGIGTLTVTNGGTITSNITGNIGSYANGSGTMTVDGTGSTWVNSNNLYVGNSGAGILNITQGGSVTCDDAYIGHATDSSGTVAVDGEGSTWTNSGSLRVGDEGTGALAITNGGTVTSDGGSVWRGTMTVDGLGSTWTSSSDLFVGNNGSSVNLVITNGGTVNVAGNTSAGYFFDSPDLVISLGIDGQGSTWTNGGMLSFSSYGTGEITITNGGKVKSSKGGIFAMPDSALTVTVNGEGSAWTVSEDLTISSYGTSSLALADGGLVAANTVMVTGSILTVDVKSALNVGMIDNNWTGYIYNDGTVRLVAGAGADEGTYTPLHYSTMDGDGIIQTLGGTWDADAHTITVSRIVTAQDSGGATAPLNLFGEQRALIIDSDTIDSDTIMSAGAGFPSTAASTEIFLTATVLGDNDLAAFKSLISETGKKVLSAWNFSVSGYDVSADSPVYISLFAGGATNILDLTIWHYADGGWSLYDTTDLAFDGTYASFTATSFSGYAVTAAIQTGKDSDLDGVFDHKDLCVNTPEGENVNSFGCSSSQLDSDNDGVKDDKDNCPDTQEDMVVDADGCALIKGDINRDEIINLKDSQLGLKILTYCQNTVDSSADVDGDGEIGLKDTIYIIQKTQRNSGN